MDTRPANQSENLTVREVKDILNTSEATVRQLLIEKRLKGFKLNRRWRVPRANLQKFMEQETPS